MDTALSDELIEFQGEVSAFLQDAISSEMRDAARNTPTVFAEGPLAMAWQAKLYSKGWAGTHWPARFGGTGWSPLRRYLFEKACAEAEAPALPSMGLHLLGPVLQEFGNKAQQDFYLDKILSGQHYWCQGFSEPNSGSDLASLKTRAVKQGDKYIVNGSKIWTTHAQFADHIFCLVRTDTEVKAQRGISFLLIDMKMPGIEVRPILSLAGDHEVNVVFFDNVEVPVSELVGEEGQGWTIAKFLLENERGGTCFAPKLLVDLARIREQASTAPSGEVGMLDQNASFTSRLAKLELEAYALKMTELRNLAELEQGRKPGPRTSMVKLAASELRQKVDALSMSLYGYAGLQLPRFGEGQSSEAAVVSKAAQMAAPRYLNSRAWTVFGGTSEIQRTIIAKTVLEL